MSTSAPDSQHLLDYETQQAALQRVRSTLWHRGNLRYKFHDTQLLILKAIEESQRRKFFVLCSRRLGKSYMLLTKCFELCIKKPGARVLYLAPFAKDAVDIATDLAVQILADCPPELRPDFNATTKEFRFPRHESILRLKGVNGEHARQLRGGAVDWIVLDECAQMDNLENIVSSVCMPMTMTTNGRIILATTPPDTPGHDSASIYEELAGAGASIKFTIRDAPHVSLATKGEFLLEAGESPNDIEGILDGTKHPKTTTARREYFCEFVTDSNRAVLPEFTADLEAQLVKENEYPSHFDAYVSMDPGFEDRTGILFGYWDFIRAKIVIEDEALIHRAATPDIAKVIKEKEAALWPNRGPYLRITDVDKRLQADLHRLHQLAFVQVQDKDALGEVNLLRSDLQAMAIQIHPRCENLRRQMRNAVWNNRATDFARPGERSVDGHFDLVAALKYLVRAIQRNRNPYPQGFYAPGGRFGPPKGSWISPKVSQKKIKMGLLPDTPLGRRLARRKKKG